MNLNEAITRIGFDIAEGEEDIVDKLVEEYNTSINESEFVYKNRKYLDMIDESRIEQFIQRIGENKRFTLGRLHEAFQKE